jgi:hypothetical protein
MYYLEITKKLVDYLLDTSSCYTVYLLIRKLLCSNQSPVLLLRQSFMHSLLLVLNHNTRIDFTVILALPFTLRRLSGATIRRLYALLKVTLITFKQSFAMWISTKCGFARRWTQEESQLSGSLQLRYLLTAL